MRALVVFAHVPHPEGTAAGRCAVALLHGLRAQGVEVTALAADIGPYGATAPPELGVEVIAVDNADTTSARATRYLKPRSLLARGAFGARARELARGVDVVHLDEIDAAALGAGLPVPHSLHQHYFIRRDQPWEPPWTAGGRAMLEVVRAERRAWRSSPHLITNSVEVAGDVATHGGPRATVMPLGLDLSHYPPEVSGAGEVAGLIGTARWPPTRNAVRRLLEDVWPRVRALRPTAELHLAGRGMVPEAFGAVEGADGVRWFGEVPAAEGFLRGLGLLLYPLDHGSGTKVKVLESLALGVPVVTTPAGAEGLPRDAATVHGTSTDLARSAAALLGDPAARRDASERGREAVERVHAPAAAAAPLVAVLRRLAATGNG